MADTKTTALLAVTSASGDDLLYVVDDPGGTPASKKITVADFLGATSNELALASTTYLYIGASGVDGSWRIGINTGNLVVEKRVTGAWVEKGLFS